jgi:hypothetical protein
MITIPSEAAEAGAAASTSDISLTEALHILEAAAPLMVEQWAKDHRDGNPEMPTSEEEWRTHCAFYNLTVAQRDHAWHRLGALKQELELVMRHTL